MLKQIIAVAFLCSVASGQFGIFDREEYAPNDVREVCWQKCSTDCRNCTEPIYCDLTYQKYCGKRERDPDRYICTPDDICVPKDCECDYPAPDDPDHTCAGCCLVNCTESCCNCKEDDDHWGCIKEDTCVNKDTDKWGNLCDDDCKNTCPVPCEPPKLRCQNDDDSNGCAVADSCFSPCLDRYGEPCPYCQCPLECHPTNEKKCCGCNDGINPENKCKRECVCKKNQVNTQSKVCPGVCPQCDCCKPNEVCCLGVVDYSDTEYCGCKGQEKCKPKMCDDDGTYCPLDSASHNCPLTCPPDEILCEPHEGLTGCKGPWECCKRTCKPCVMEATGICEYCPQVSDCPKRCPPISYPCPGCLDPCGCKREDICVYQYRDFEGQLCPFHCPECCGENQVLCEGVFDDKGCKAPDTCKDKSYHQWGSDFDNCTDETNLPLCPGWCPTQCEDHEILCPSQLDPCNGCPTDEVCREAIKGINELFCPGKEITGCPTEETSKRIGGCLSASHNCPHLCREGKPWFEVLCPSYEDNTGCKPAASCKTREFGYSNDKNGNEVKTWCPYQSVCPIKCGDGQILCTYEEKDLLGCTVGEKCVELIKGYNQLWCAGTCPPICSKGETLEYRQYNGNGCKSQPYCKPIEE